MERTLERMARNLLGGLKPKDGLSEAKLTQLERRLKRSLPQTLRTFYSLVGKHRVLMGAQNHFLPPEKLVVENDGLVFLEENQNVCFWAILQKHIDEPDPPVHQGNFEESKWYLDARHLSAFLVGQACWQAAMGFAWSAQGRCTPKQRRELCAELTFADPGVVDRTNELAGYYEKGLVVSLSQRSTRSIFVGAEQQTSLERFEKRFGISLDHL